MNKDDEFQIYMLTHKIPEYGLWDNEYFTPLHCGKALTDEYVCDVCDNTGDNISSKNRTYLEATGIYWIWKNTDHDLVGQCQYRRRLFTRPLFVFKNILKDNDIIVAKHLSVPVYKQYAACHNSDDMDVCGNIIHDKFPEFYDPYVKYIVNGNILFYSNGFITHRTIYNGLCEFCFGVLEQYEKELDLETYDDWLNRAKLCENKGNPHNEIRNIEYQARIGGALFERLSTLYILTTCKNIIETPYLKMEENIL